MKSIALSVLFLTILASIISGCSTDRSAQRFVPIGSSISVALDTNTGQLCRTRGEPASQPTTQPTGTEDQPARVTIEEIMRGVRPLSQATPVAPLPSCLDLYRQFQD